MQCVQARQGPSDAARGPTRIGTISESLKPPRIEHQSPRERGLLPCMRRSTSEAVLRYCGANARGPNLSYRTV